MAIKTYFTDPELETIIFANLRLESTHLFGDTVQKKYVRKQFTNCVLALGEYSERDDSDFYAVVWDQNNQCVYRTTYDSTRYAGGGEAEVDATEEIMQIAQKWVYHRILRELEDQNERDAGYPTKRKIVEIVKGKKDLRGIIGEIFWTKDCESKQGVCFTRCGIKEVDFTTGDYVVDSSLSLEEVKKFGSAKTHWTAVHNVKVIEPEKYLAPHKDLEAKAEELASHRPWRAITAGSLYRFVR